MRELSLNDLDRLQAFLVSLGEGAMLLEELDGYLAGIIVCPEMIPPSEWLPRVWGEEGVFENLEEANDMMGLVMALNNDIVRSLRRANGYVPRLDADSHGLTWELWASGFGQALDLRPWAWAPYHALANDDPTGIAIRLIGSLARAADEPGGGDLPEDLEHLLSKKADVIIAGCVQDLNDARLDAVQAQRPKKVRPNAPCPCGSGNKYKKCCGQAQNP